MQKQIPCGNDNQKGKCKSGGRRLGNGESKGVLKSEGGGKVAAGMLAGSGKL